MHKINIFCNIQILPNIFYHEDNYRKGVKCEHEEDVEVGVAVIIEFLDAIFIFCFRHEIIILCFMTSKVFPYNVSDSSGCNMIFIITVMPYVCNMATMRFIPSIVVKFS